MDMFANSFNLFLCIQKSKLFKRSSSLANADAVDHGGPSNFTCHPSTSSAKPIQVQRGRIIVNNKQRGNPLLNTVTQNAWEYGDIRPDFVMGRTCCALFLSLKYHQATPSYIYDRVNDLGSNYQLRVLLVLVDVENANYSLKELVKVCLLGNLVLMCAWSYEEAGHIIDTYKSYENKSAEALMEKGGKKTDYQCILDAISSIKTINKTDAISLVTTFGSLDKLMKAKSEALELCPGLGPTKANVLHEFFHRKMKR